MLESAERFARTHQPHRLAHLQLCRAYVEDFAGNAAAAVAAFDTAAATTAQVHGRAGVPAIALQARAGHFAPPAAGTARRPHFAAAGLEQLLQEFSEMINQDRVHCDYMSITPVGLRSDPFFHQGWWISKWRREEAEDRLALRFEPVDPATVPGECGGLRVSNVPANPVAAAEGVRDGDLLVDVDGRATVGNTSLWLATASPGRSPPYRCKFLRGDKTFQAWITTVK
jgi:hypothetical protein